MINLNGILALSMRNVNVHLVIVNASVWYSHSSEFYMSTWLKYD